MTYHGKSGFAFKDRLLSFIMRIDFMQLIAMAGLLTIGLVFIYGTGQQVGDKATVLWKKQLVWAGVGFVFWLYLAFFFDYRKLIPFAPFFYVICLVALVLVLIIGVKVYGARRWFIVGGTSIQPSEFAKFAVLFMAAWILSFRRFKLNRLTHLAGLGVACGVPFLLIIVEPDLGTGIVFIPMIASMLFIAGIKWRWIVIGIIAVAVLIPCAYPFLKDYQKERILVFVNPDRDPVNRGWNSLQSQLAVGSGGAYGKGFMQGTQNILGFLPKNVSYTDFIFSVIAEETGFAGSALVVVLYLMLIASALRAAVFAPDDFGKYIAAGIAGIFFVHSFVNIGMTIRIMPITGIPLPLISYGGTFMMVTMIFLGLIQSVYAHREKSWG